ncbi:MAG: HEPN-associated N-terminal domain-containing protein [Bryobacteraceae bacterium]|jgi:hypothetical protein
MNSSEVTQPSPGVCAECFADESIKAFVRERAVWNECHFCKGLSSAPIAAPIDAVADFVLEGIASWWTTDTHETDFDDDTGYSSWSSNNTEELLRLDGMDQWQPAPWTEPPIRDGAVIDEISRLLGPQTWYIRLLTRETPGAKLVFDWGDFCERIKHKSRFSFHAPLEGDFDAWEPESFPTADILDELADLVRAENLVTIEPAGTKLFRARQHDPKRKKEIETAGELGPPPPTAAPCANRMSPAGIVMFYGAYDAETASREGLDYGRWSQGKTMITVGTFVAKIALRVVDLRKSKMLVPSIFDPQKRPTRSAIQFLRDFAEEVGHPIAKDGREHVEYVPTQVVAEYFRRMFKDNTGNPVQGILYDSSQFGGGTCCALFLDAEQCGVTPPWPTRRRTPREQVLRFAGWKHFEVDVDPVFRPCGAGAPK